MSDLSQIPTEQLLAMLGQHLDAPKPQGRGQYNVDAPTMFASQYIPGGDYAIAGEGYLADKLTHPVATAKALYNAATGNSGRTLSSLITGETPDNGITSFNDELKQFRKEKDQYSAAHPYMGAAAELAGGFTNPVFNKMTGVIGDAIPGSSALAKYTRFGAQGTGIGALAGATNAQSDDGGLPSIGDLADSTLTGGGTGLLTGVGLPLLGKALASGAKLVGSAAGGLLSKFSTPENRGARLAELALRRDSPLLPHDQLVPDALGRLSDLGPDAVPADLGPNMQGAARAAANRPGLTLTASKDMANRQFGQGDRIWNSALEAVGAKHPDELTAKRSTITQPLFEKAFAPLSDGPVTTKSPQITSPDIEALLATDEAQPGLQHGMDDLKRESVIQRTQLDPNDYALRRGENGQWEKVGTPNLRTLDALRRGWSGQLADKNDASLYHDNGTMTNKGRQLSIFLDRLTSEIDSQLPKDPTTGKSDWMTAIDKWGEMTKPITALNRVGTALDKARDMTDITGKLYGSKAARDAVAGLTSDPVKMAKFEQALKREATFAETNRTRGGSQTQYLNAAQADQDHGAAGINAIADLVTNPTPGNALVQFLRGVKGWATRPDQEVADVMAPMYSRDPAVRDAFIASINNRITGAGLLGRTSNAIRQQYGLLGSGDPFDTYASRGTRTTRDAMRANRLLGP